MAIIDLYDPASKAESRRALRRSSKRSLVRYDGEALMHANRLLHEAGATDAMIGRMTMREVQELIMASDEERPEMLKELAGRCTEAQESLQSQEMDADETTLRFIGGTAMQGA